MKLLESSWTLSDSFKFEKWSCPGAGRRQVKAALQEVSSDLLLGLQATNLSLNCRMRRGGKENPLGRHATVCADGVI